MGPNKMVNAKPSLLKAFSLKLARVVLSASWGSAMHSLSPSVQDEAAGAETARNAVESAQAVLTGPAAVLWVGIGALILIFLLVLMLLIRGRVVRPMKAKNVNREFFEPAGEGAEITFEDDETAATEFPSKEKDANPFRRDHRNLSDEAEVVISKGPSEATEPEPEPAVEELPLMQKPKRGPFAGIFGKKHKEAATEIIEAPEEDASIAQEEFAEARHDDEDGEWRREEEERLWAEEKERAEREEREREREKEEQRRRLLEEERLEAERQAAFERRKSEATFEDREKAIEEKERPPADSSDTLRADVERLHARLGESLDERFAAFSRELKSHLEDIAGNTGQASIEEDRPVVSEAYFAEFAELLSEQIASWRDAVNASIDRLSRRIDQLNTSPQGGSSLAKEIAELNRILGARHAAGTAGQIQLSDLLGDALPPGRFTLSHKLSNGRTASACINMPGRLAPIAIDARFPLEAFDEYQKLRLDPSQEIKASNEFRRIALRHIADVAERMIVSDETADCAMMFVPSEHILSTLHENFSDLVQESYRARVWIVSPTSLMATLQTISAVMNGKGGSEDAHRGPGADLIDEIAALRKRVAALEGEKSETKPEKAENAPEKGDLLEPPEEKSGRESTPEETPKDAKELPSGSASDKDLPPFPLR